MDVDWSQIRGQRRYQQDSAAIVTIDESRCLLVLSDGMGGHRGGDVASVIVVSRFCDAWSGSLGSGDEPARLLVALEAANSAVRDRIVAQEELAGMGATLLAASVNGEDLYWVSVGDSPLWLYRGGVLSRLNENHSVAGVLEARVRAGQITAEEAAASPERSQLLEAVVGGTIRLVDVPALPCTLEAGDVVVLASDGVETCSVSELEALIGRGPATASELTGRVLGAVEARGLRDQDNATVLVLCL